MTTNNDIFNKILDLRLKIDDYKNNLLKINYFVDNQLNIKNIINYNDTYEKKYNYHKNLINIILFLIFFFISIFIIKIISIYLPLNQPL
jgi:hypothetical protein